MKYVDEYRDESAAKILARKIGQIATRPWTIMEVCGGQTHAILKSGLDRLLPERIRLLHGPGCPVCVTPLELVEKAIRIASNPEVIFCSFGDMLRVPGRKSDLLAVKAQGGDVRIVYSPLDAVKIAKEHPERQVVFFAVGFETTAPANALALVQADIFGVQNFSMLVSHVLVPPAIESLLSSPENCVQGFLAAGHVCAVMGFREYIPIAQRFRVPVVVTGFEPLDILQGIHMCICQLETGRYVVENQYSRAVKEEGNLEAKALMRRVFEVVPRKWRGIGELDQSGLGLTAEFKRFDAEQRFGTGELEVEEPLSCISGQVLRGISKPPDCPEFGNLCTPEHPLGATMVSSEGACAAYFRYRFHESKEYPDG